MNKNSMNDFWEKETYFYLHRADYGFSNKIRKNQQHCGLKHNAPKYFADI